MGNHTQSRNDFNGQKELNLEQTNRVLTSQPSDPFEQQKFQFSGPAECYCEPDTERYN